MPSRLAYPDAFWEALRAEVRRADPSPHGRSQAAALKRLLREYGEGTTAPANYLQEPSTRAAYLRAFLPFELDKAAHALGQVGARFQALAGAPELRVVDAGCGPGSASLGLLAYLGRLDLRPRVRLTLTDRSREALAIARRLLETLAALVRIDLEVRDQPGTLLPRDRADLVLLQNCLSEVATSSSEQASILESALRLAGSGLVVVVEPADRRRSRLLLGARDALLQTHRARVLAPCLRQGDCPALRAPGDWCHMELPYQPSREQRMGLREATFPRHSLKFSYLVLERRDPSDEPVPGAGTPYRVVSDVLASRGARELYVCGDSGRTRIRLLTRHASATNRELRRLRRGDVVELSPAPPTDAPSVDLDSDSSVRRRDGEGDADAGAQLPLTGE